MGTIPQQLERNIEVCEELAGIPLADDLLLFSSTDVRFPELRSKLELFGNEVPFPEGMDDVVAYIERRRDASIRPVPMDVRNHEDEEELTYHAFKFQSWGGATGSFDMEDGCWVNAQNNLGWEEVCFPEVAT